MTVMEFESWVSDHYTELVKRARIASKFQEDLAIPVLHQVIEYVLEKPETRIPKLVNGGLFEWFYAAMTMTAKANFRGVTIRAELFDAIESDLRLLGEGEVFSNTVREARHNRYVRGLFKVEVREVGGAGRVGWPEWFIGGVPGFRREVDQASDGASFDARATASLSKSIRGVSRRARTAVGFGVPYVLHGTEYVTRNTQDVSATHPWTSISSSTGNHHSKGYHPDYTLDQPSDFASCAGCVQHVIDGTHGRACPTGGTR